MIVSSIYSSDASLPRVGRWSVGRWGVKPSASQFILSFNTTWNNRGPRPAGKNLAGR